jgi:hypothetical protein
LGGRELGITPTAENRLFVLIFARSWTNRIDAEAQRERQPIVRATLDATSSCRRI